MRKSRKAAKLEYTVNHKQIYHIFFNRFCLVMRTMT